MAEVDWNRVQRDLQRLPLQWGEDEPSPWGQALVWLARQAASAEKDAALNKCFQLMRKVEYFPKTVYLERGLCVEDHSKMVHNTRVHPIRVTIQGMERWYPTLEEAAVAVSFYKRVQSGDVIL